MRMFKVTRVAVVMASDEGDVAKKLYAWDTDLAFRKNQELIRARGMVSDVEEESTMVELKEG